MIVVWSAVYGVREHRRISTRHNDRLLDPSALYSNLRRGQVIAGQLLYRRLEFAACRRRLCNTPLMHDLQ